MLDDYIRQCDAVIHLVGDMTGAPAQAPSLTVIRYRYPDLGEKLPPLAPYPSAWRVGAFLHAVGGVARAVPPQAAHHRRARGEHAAG
jgi:hypothetical protein